MTNAFTYCEFICCSVSTYEALAMGHEVVLVYIQTCYLWASGIELYGTVCMLSAVQRKNTATMTVCVSEVISPLIVKTNA